MQNDKYDRILQAAIDVIAAKSFQKTTITDIVQKAETAQGTFYLYFPSKNALIPAIATRLLASNLQQIQSRVSPYMTFHEALRIFIDETFAMTKQHKDVIALCYAGTAFDYSMTTWEKIYEPLYTWFNNLLQTAIENEEIEWPHSISWAAKFIVNTVENAAERFYIMEDNELSVTESKDLLMNLLCRSFEPLFFHTK